MLSFQVVSAVSVPLLLSVGPTATTWLRLIGAAALLWLLAPPDLSGAGTRGVMAAGLLGGATCGMAVLYAEAITRIPLGMVTAIEFTGPLAVAVATSRRAADAGWAMLAGSGVMLLTLSGLGWSGDPVGFALAATAAACWAVYILLTKRVGEFFPGLSGLTVSLTVAALVAAPFGVLQRHDGTRPAEIAAAVALGVAIPLVPYGLELLALRRMSTRAFGILMSVDPAIAGLAGWLVLDQALGVRKMIGIACVIAASIGTTLTRRR
jgi:inner membrane transporter RhtA